MLKIQNRPKSIRPRQLIERKMLRKRAARSLGLSAEELESSSMLSEGVASGRVSVDDALSQLGSVFDPLLLQHLDVKRVVLPFFGRVPRVKAESVS
jgi:hypothetical protein